MGRQLLSRLWKMIEKKSIESMGHVKVSTAVARITHFRISAKCSMWFMRDGSDQDLLCTICTRYGTVV